MKLYPALFAWQLQINLVALNKPWKRDCCRVAKQ